MHDWTTTRDATGRRVARRAPARRFAPGRLWSHATARHGRLRPGRSRRPVRGARLGRPDARAHPPGRAGADRPRPEPVPRVGRRCGTPGLPTTRRPTAISSPRSSRGGDRGGHGRARDRDELRGVPHPAVALRDGRGPGDGPRAAGRDDGEPVLQDGLRGHGRRLAGRAGQPDRGGRARVRADRRRARGRALQGPGLQPGQRPARGGQARRGHARPEPLAAARAGQADLPERPADPRHDPVVHRSALGARDAIRAADVRPTGRPIDPGPPPQARRGHGRGIQGRGRRDHPPQLQLDAHRRRDAIDIGPGAFGGNTLGANDGTGHAVNPATGQPYEPHVGACAPTSPACSPSTGPTGRSRRRRPGTGT